MTKLCNEIVHGHPCTRIAHHEGVHDWRERANDSQQIDGTILLGALCGKILADGSLCTRYRGYRKGLADLPHDGACDSSERAIEQEPPVALPLAYLDIETGGISLACSTVQVAVVLPSWSQLSPWPDPQSFSSFMRPTFGALVVEPEALAYNGIDLRAAIEWPRQDDVAMALRAWADERFAAGVKLTACGFNVRFDVDRLDMICPGLFSHRVLDLTAVALFHSLPSKSNELIEMFGDPEITDLHDALADAKQAQAVHMGMMHHLRGGG